MATKTDKLGDTALLIKNLATAADAQLAGSTVWSTWTGTVTTTTGAAFTVDLPGLGNLSGCLLQTLYTGGGTPGSDQNGLIRGYPIITAFNPGGFPGRLGGVFVPFNNSGAIPATAPMVISVLAWGTRP